MVQTSPPPLVVMPPSFYRAAHNAAIEVYKQLQRPGLPIDTQDISRLSIQLYDEQEFDDPTHQALGSLSAGRRSLLLWQMAVGIEVGELNAHC